jgi:hypothetical protein
MDAIGATARQPLREKPWSLSRVRFGVVRWRLVRSVKEILKDRLTLGLGDRRQEPIQVVRAISLGDFVHDRLRIGQTWVGEV